MQDSSLSPVISLPQGGGALKGLGETFAPDLHTGTGNFSVPIALPPGRNGFQPQLTTAYSTGNGNGPFGLGWRLSTPGVSRKTANGIPRYLNDEDTFLISGSEDLIPVAGSSALMRYRPRTEGLFARIEHHHDAATDHWQVHGKDGLVTFYGTPGRAGNDPAVVADPANRSKVFNWKITRTSDPFGNSILYEYERDAGETSEHNWDQLYLKRIRYADYVDSQNSERFLVSVTFVYEERPDPFSEYRAGFEIRTQRRCSRIEVRTHAEVERLVRVYHFIYLDQRGLPPEQLPLNAVSLLSQVVVEGHDEQSSESLPPLEFRYTAFEPVRRRFQPFTAVGDSVPEQSLADSAYELVDLFGNGLPDVIHTNGVVRYWRNLGNGRFDLPRTMETAPPSVHLNDPGVQLADANGNGRADLIVLDGVQNGYYPLTFNGNWDRRGFVRYDSVPSVNLDAPDVRLIDLDGDGVTDALRTGPNFELYYNDPIEGWSGVEIRERENSDSFPNVTFGDPRVKLGDLTGDGLQDIALIHNGRVEYWPYLGYGRWDRRVTMRNSPRFEDAAFFPGVGFDPKRLLIGDVDGDGAADLVYISSGHITLWINQGGNAWSDPIVIHGTPPVTDASSVRLADMLGNGTDGILWTYDFTIFRDSTYKFLDLTGGVKPYLLDQMDNHLGAITKVSYASSTRFSVEDQKQPETRWKTPLPFPVQVVARVEVIDEISRGKLTTEYHYHHGYWDGLEREFRGFGMVEQLDTESFADYHAPSDTTFESIAEDQFSPPTLTKTWFHLGPIADQSGDQQELDWSSDYSSIDPPALAHLEAINSFLQGLSDPRAKRDALRALRGSTLRTELYALDGSDREHRPYTVTEHAYDLREESVPDANDRTRLRIFFPHMITQRTTQWERGDEPMTQFSFSDDFDAYGQSRSQVSLAVPRGRDYRVTAAASDPYLGVQTLTTYAQRDDGERYIVNRVCGSSTFEISNDGTPPLLQLYEAIRSGSAARNLIAQSFNYYDGEAFVGLAHFELGDFGALTRTETLVLTEKILSEVHGGASNVPPYLRPGGVPNWTNEYPLEFRDRTAALAGYAFADGSDHRARGYFVQSTRVEFDFQIFQSNSRRGLHLATLDPLGNRSSVSYDEFQLLPASVTDAAGLVTVAENDYRVMQPRMITDPNGNRSRGSFTPLGLLKEVFVMGKAGVSEGDSERPSTRFVYDFLAFEERRLPASVRAINREHHDTESDVEASERDATFETIEHSDGFGRVVQTRTQAEDVIFEEDVLPANQADVDGAAAAVVGRKRAPGGEPHVVVSGWQVYDNKGRVVEKYEPFFSTGSDFAPRADAQRGQKIVMFYDPRGQVIRTVNPDGSEQSVIYGVPEEIANPENFAPTPWEAWTYDPNDNAGRTHAGAAQSYRHHWNTPSNIIVDALGRTVAAIARNRSAIGKPIEEVSTHSTYDLRGNLLTLIDALGRPAFTCVYDLANQPLRTNSIDAGVRRVSFNGAGGEIERRDSKGALTLQAYDVLNRPMRLWARDDSASLVTLRQVIEYGDGGRRDQDSQSRQSKRLVNCLGRPSRHYDEAGRVAIEAYDFKGNVLEKVREVVSDEDLLTAFSSAGGAAPGYSIDWQPDSGDTLERRATALLDRRQYRTSLTYDALNRLKSVRYPQDADGERKTSRPRYNRAGKLEGVTLDAQSYVSHIAYNARGQHTLLARGNGVLTRYAYEPQTFRLKRLRSERYTQPELQRFQPTGALLQDFVYDYDLAGNIRRIAERVRGCGIQNNTEALLEQDPLLRSLMVSGDALVRRFDYDAIYRLSSATGRESAALSGTFPGFDDPQRMGFNSPNHGTPNQGNAPNLTTNYRESYEYDAAGNLLQLKHARATNGFTRVFRVASSSNRVHKMDVGQASFNYQYDENGNMTRETESRRFFWDHGDHLKAFVTQTGNSASSVQALYFYDASGMRVKKLVRKQGGALESTVYVDDLFEHQGWQLNGTTNGENNHLHVMDAQQRISMVRVGIAHPGDRGPAVQFHLSDYLGSGHVVVDASGAFINREEFTPYGESSFGGFASKRYRFTGKERDEESGMNYNWARYYSGGLAKWASCDPKQATDFINSNAADRSILADPTNGGIDARKDATSAQQLLKDMNLYQFNHSNPVTFVDIDGREPGLVTVGKTIWTLQSSGRDVAKAANDTNPLSGFLHLGAAGLTLTRYNPISLFLSGWATGIESHFEARSREREKAAARKDAHDVSIEVYILSQIRVHAAATEASNIYYSQAQRSRIEGISEKIYEWARRNTQRETISERDHRLIDLTFDEVHFGKFFATDSEIAILEGLFEDLDVEIFSGETEKARASLPESYARSSYTVQGLDFSRLLRQAETGVNPTIIVNHTWNDKQ